MTMPMAHRHARRVLALTLTAIILAGGGVLVAGPIAPTAAHAALQAPSAVQAPATARIALAHAVSLTDALTAAQRSGRDVIGYRYADLSIVGEYFPNDDVTPDRFEAAFREQFGAAPRITELIVRPVVVTAEGRALATAAIEPNRTDGDSALTAGLRDVAVAEAGNGPTWPTTLDTGTVPGGPYLAPSPQADSGAELRPQAQRTATSITLPHSWKPNNVQISASGSQSFGGLTSVNMQSHWIVNPGASGIPYDFHGVPDKWGVEFSISLHDTALEETHPALQRTPTIQGECAGITDLRNRFWARNDSGAITGWSVYNIGSQTLDEIGAYLDWNDEANLCSEQRFSVGIGYPKNVGHTPNGNFEFVTSVITGYGTSTGNLVPSEIRAVEGYSCDVFPYVAPDTGCMGTDPSRAWPVTNHTSNVTLLPRGGAAQPAAPGTPIPVYSGDKMIPETCVSYQVGRVPSRGCTAG